MNDVDDLLEKFNKCCFTLSEKDILKLDKEDNGPINNVISRISNHCFVVKLYDDEYGLTVEMFYINNLNGLKGDVINLNVNDQDYYLLLLQFCALLSDSYTNVDALDAFNTFQTKLRGFLEKSGFFTTTNLELKKFEGKGAVMMGTSPRGIIKVDFIDKPQYYHDFFNNNYISETVEGNDYVYLMLNNDTSLIKIGTSKKPKYRERTLHSQEPAIHIIAKWCCGKEVEKKLHNKFDHKRVRGEWFRLSLKELIDIEEFMKPYIANPN